jgi:taurine dioxygenase
MWNRIQVDCNIGPIGAVISGVDLKEKLDDEVVDEIHRAWLAHQVIFFRDQDLTPPQQAAFGELFGELDTYPFMKSVESHPNVIPIIKEPETKINFGGAWHTDSSYKEVPPKATILYAIEVPKTGGDTLFASATDAYLDLSDGMKTTLDNMTGVFTPKMVHGSGGGYDTKAMKKELGPDYGGNEEFAESEVEHPIIRTHGDTGNKSIYCSKPHTHRIKGWSHEESHAIFSFLTKHLTQEAYVTQFKWGKGSLAMWDNRCVFHNALNDYPGERRHMHRVTIKGERPI